MYGVRCYSALCKLKPRLLQLCTADTTFANQFAHLLLGVIMIYVGNKYKDFQVCITRMKRGIIKSAVHRLLVLVPLICTNCAHVFVFPIRLDSRIYQILDQTFVNQCEEDLCQWLIVNGTYICATAIFTVGSGVSTILW